MTAAIASDPILIDSSGWLEYITKDSKAEFFAPYFQRPNPEESQNSLLVPTIVLFEVRKVLLLRATAPIADLFVSEAVRYRVIELDRDIALEAAKLAVRYQLHMADAIIYGTAMHYQAQLITSDSHFANLPGVTIL